MEQPQARKAVRRLSRQMMVVADDLHAAMEDAYRDGVSLSELAEDMGRSVETVRKLLRDRGVEMRRQGRRSTAP